MYVKACVHLAEIYSSEGRLGEAESLLRRVIAIGDPEVDWRLADVLAAQCEFEEAEARMKAAHSGFESLLDRHLLAFADHGAEFYAGSGGDLRRLSNWRASMPTIGPRCVRLNRPTSSRFLLTTQQLHSNSYPQPPGGDSTIPQRHCKNIY